MPNACRELCRLIGSESKVLLLVAAGLLLGEVGMRAIQDRLSLDVRHLHSLAQIASAVGPQTRQHPQVLFLGNSMTRHGVSPDVFAQEFAKQTGVTPLTIKVNPDNTALADWYYAYRDYFFKTDHPPDIVVLGFEGRHLEDRPTRHPSRLAQYYCDLKDWPQLGRYDLKTVDDWAEYLLSSVSTMVSNRDRIQRRVLDTLIPSYRDGSQMLNEKQSALAQRVTPPPTYDRLKEFIDMARQQNVEVYLAAMPIAQDYELDPGLLKLIRSENVHLIDCRHVPGMDPSMFPDGIHMTQDASKIYSRYLADQLSTIVEPAASKMLPVTARLRHAS